MAESKTQPKKGGIFPVVLIGVGIAMVMLGIFIFFIIRDMTKSAIKDAMIIDSKDHSGYEKWQNDRMTDASKAMYEDYYMWNFSNPEAWARGEEKAKFTEIGPFTYRIYTDRVNVSFFNDGNEVSYKEHWTYHFQPDLSVSSDETTMICNVNPFYVAAIGQSGGVEDLFDKNLVAGQLALFTNATEFGSSTTHVSAGGIMGFANAFKAGGYTLKTLEAQQVLNKLTDVVTLATWSQLVTMWTQAFAAGQTAVADQLAAQIDATVPNGPDFRNIFAIPYPLNNSLGNSHSSATLMIGYINQVAAGARAQLTGLFGAANSLFFRNIPARNHIFGPDPFFAFLQPDLPPAGYATNHTDPLMTGGQATVFTGKNDDTQMGMDSYTQYEGVRESRVYVRANGEGPVVSLADGQRMVGITPWKSYRNAPATSELYFDELERILTIIKAEKTKVENIPTQRYTADFTGELSTDMSEFNVTHQGYAGIAFKTGGIPFFLSQPHQQGTAEPYLSAIDSNVFAYNKDIHETRLDMELTTGLPLSAQKVIQMNLQLNFTATQYGGVNPAQKDIMVPMFWANQRAKISSSSAKDLHKAVVGAVQLRQILLGVLAGLGGALIIGGFVAMLVTRVSNEGESEKKYGTDVDDKDC